MKEYCIEVDGHKVTFIIKHQFRRMVVIEIINPYRGLILNLTKGGAVSDLRDDAQAEEYVMERMNLIVKQIENVIRYRSVYQNIYDKYKKISDTMDEELKSMTLRRGDIVDLYAEWQKRVPEGMNKELKSIIPEITDENQDEFFVHPNFLKEYLAVV